MSYVTDDDNLLAMLRSAKSVNHSGDMVCIELKGGRLIITASHEDGELFVVYEDAT